MTTYPQTRRTFIKSLAAVPALQQLKAEPSTQERPPNILLIMADDLGAGELGCYGNRDHSTPNLDALARSGVRFRTCWSTPLCSPSRVELLTGRYGFRTGWYNFIGRETTRLGHLDEAEVTFADVVKTRSYATGLAGKWQLGLISERPKLIFEHGFDEYCATAWKKGGLPAGSDFDGTEQQFYWHPALIQNGKYRPTKKTDYGPDLYSDWIIEFMARNAKRPFLAYYPMHLVHRPWDPVPDASQPASRGSRGFRACVEYMDSLVGRLVGALERMGLREDTIIFFTGDNGTGQEGKGTATELGVRVPMIVSCPGRLRSNVISDELVDFSDVLPTIADLTGSELPQDRPIDGRSFAAILRGEPGTRRSWIFSYLAYERILRDKRWLLEGDGRFYDCGDSREGTGYKDVTVSSEPEVLNAQRRFDEILKGLPAPMRESLRR